MGFQKLQKFIFSNLFFCIYFAFATDVNAERRNIPDSMTSDDPLCEEISYSYEIFFDEETNNYDCIGTLCITLSLPENCTKVLLERTYPHLLEDEDNFRKLFLRYKRECVVEDNKITIPNIYWGTFFRIRAQQSDNSWINSPIYHTNNYIESSDLDIILNSTLTSLYDVKDDNVTIQFINKDLHIHSPEVFSVTIYDLSGNAIFNGINQNTFEIPVDNVVSPFIIIFLKKSNNLIIKKFFLK